MSEPRTSVTSEGRACQGTRLWGAGHAAFLGLGAVIQVFPSVPSIRMLHTCWKSVHRFYFTCWKSVHRLFLWPLTNVFCAYLSLQMNPHRTGHYHFSDLISHNSSTYSFTRLLLFSSPAGQQPTSGPSCRLFYLLRTLSSQISESLVSHHLHIFTLNLGADKLQPLSKSSHSPRSGNTPFLCSCFWTTRVQ